MLKSIRLVKGALALLVCFVMILACGYAGNPVAYARSASEINQDIAALEAQSKQLEKEISSLKSQKNQQAAIKAKIETQIANTQQQIALCNSRLTQYNNEIAANKAKIAQKEQEKADTIFLFKQRLRTIYMSNGSSTIQVLLGADSFADYLALEQLTKVVSAHDKKTVEKIIALVDEINVAQAEINQKVEAQNEVKATLAAKKAELDSQVSQVNSVIADINATTAQTQQANKSIESTIKALEAELAPYISKTSSVVYDGSQFTWPVPGHSGITSYFGMRWGTMHAGIDISDGGIRGAAIVAVADGVVVKTYNSCPHDYPKSGSCGCGGGWGNYVLIDHGSYQGKSYKSLCGHMTRTAVSAGQTVKKGQTIGYVGTTGYSTGNHCHFEIYLNGTRVNPLNYYNKVK